MPFGDFATTIYKVGTLSEKTREVETFKQSERGGSIGRFALGGFTAGVIFGILLSCVEYFDHGRNPHDLPLTINLILYPLIGAGLGFLYHRNPDARRGVRPDSFFAIGPLSALENEERGRRIRKFVWTGFGTGIVLALVATALDFAWRGWPFLSDSLNFSLIFYPYIGAVLGYNLSLRQGDPNLSIRNLRFSMSTLMILVAYIALSLGLGSQAARVSGDAKLYHAKSVSAQAMTEVFRGLREKSQVDVSRMQNAQALRNGLIPEGLLKAQKDFLKSLDQTANAEYTTYRYSLIADGEEVQARLAEGNVETFDRLINYYMTLAKKYRQGAQEPWVPLDPDPPVPQ